MLTFLLSAMAGSSSSASADATGSLVTTFVTFGLIILIFYFLMIRPQKKKDREMQDMLGHLKKGDKVVSIGGIYGTVIAVRDKSIILKVDDNTRMEFSKSAISSVVNKKGNAGSASHSKKVETIQAPAAKEPSAGEANGAPEKSGRKTK